jgi:hypothetical protein
MAKKRGIPSVYVPEMSRMVCCGGYGDADWNARNKQIILSLFEKYGIGIDEPVLMVDTGYFGSIVRAVGDAVGHPIKFALMSQGYKTNLLPLNSFPAKQRAEAWGTYIVPRKGHNIDPNSKPNQLFPNRKTARKEVLDTEYLPKYFKTGTLRDGS